MFFLDRQQCEGKPLLHFYGNLEDFNTFYIYIKTKNNKREKYCCGSMATMVTRTRHDVTLYLYCLLCSLSFHLFEIISVYHRMTWKNNSSFSISL